MAGENGAAFVHHAMEMVAPVVARPARLPHLAVPECVHLLLRQLCRVGEENVWNVSQCRQNRTHHRRIIVRRHIKVHQLQLGHVLHACDAIVQIAHVQIEIADAQIRRIRPLADRRQFGIGQRGRLVELDLIVAERGRQILGQIFARSECGEHLARVAANAHKVAVLVAELDGRVPGRGGKVLDLRQNVRMGAGLDVNGCVSGQVAELELLEFGRRGDYLAVY